MKKSNKVIILAFLLFITSMCIGLYEKNNIAFANLEQPKTQYILITTFGNNLSISSTGKATISAEVTTSTSNTLKLTSTLQQFNEGRWVNVKSWSSTSKGFRVIQEELVYIYSGYLYRVYSQVSIYSENLLIESAHRYSTQRSY